MFCPKCGSQFAENEKRCQNCGYELMEEPKVIPEAVKSEEFTAISTSQSANQRLNSIIRTAFFVLAGIVLIMSLYGAHCIAVGGLNISSIESVGGQTLEEAYYQYLGTVYSGYATAIRATGIFFASVLGYFGIKG